MKKFLRYLPYILYTLGFVSFILPVVYDSFDGASVSYNSFDIMFGLGGQEKSIGLILAFLMFLIGIVFSITIEKKPSNFRLSIAIILTLAAGVLFFFSRMLANPNLTNFKINIGLILPGLFIVSGSIILFINKKIIANKKDE